MNTKQVILLIIVIAALAGAGVFGYFMMTETQPPVELTEESLLEILPQGTELDFKDVNEFNKTGKLFRYPVVTPTEVKVELNSLMQPAPASNQ